MVCSLAAGKIQSLARCAIKVMAEKLGIDPMPKKVGPEKFGERRLTFGITPFTQDRAGEGTIWIVLELAQASGKRGIVLANPARVKGMQPASIVHDR